MFCFITMGKAYCSSKTHFIIWDQHARQFWLMLILISLNRPLELLAGGAPSQMLYSVNSSLFHWAHTHHPFRKLWNILHVTPIC